MLPEMIVAERCSMRGHWNTGRVGGIGGHGGQLL